MNRLIELLILAKDLELQEAVKQAVWGQELSADLYQWYRSFAVTFSDRTASGTRCAHVLSDQHLGFIGNDGFLSQLLTDENLHAIRYRNSE